MIEELVKDLVLKLMEEQKMSMSDALDAVYNSDTYEKSWIWRPVFSPRVPHMCTASLGAN